MRRKNLIGLGIFGVAGVAGLILAATPATPTPQAAPATPATPAAIPDAPTTDPILAQIREEGLQRSQVMQTLSYLTNVIGPRFSGSPNLKKANEWTRDEMTKFGLANAHLESWPFNGKGWTVKRFTMQVTEPQQISLIAYPKAWSAGLDKPLTAPVVLMEARTEADLQAFHGKLKGAIVLDGGVRAIGPSFTPEAARLTDRDLERLANVAPNGNVDTQPPRTPAARGGAGAAAGAGGAAAPGALGRGPATTSARGLAAGGGLQRNRVIAFLIEEGAAMELTVTTGSETGVIVGQAAAILPTAPGAAGAAARGGGGGGRGGQNAYAMTAPDTLPQVTVAAEHYNRLVRIAQAGVPIKMEVDLQVEYVKDDPNCYNTIAEIPGTDLKDEVVMLGAHLDSWHMGTGATDNGTGVAECMEAVRIIKALGIQPRRTIRVGLWTGEEEGLLGSRTYVRNHFGANRGELVGGGRGGRGGGRGAGAAATEPAAAEVAATGPAAASSPSGFTADQPKFSVYFNTDEGGGRFRGVSVGNHPGQAEVMKQWLAPVKDLGISFVSLGHSTGSDHQSFESASLPAIVFVPDPIDYWAGTWHTSQDLYDHVVPEDVKSASVVMATCIYQAAMATEKMPRR